MKIPLILLILISIILLGCSRYYHISKDEIAEEYKEDAIIKVVFKDSTERVFEKSELIFNSSDTVFVIVEDGYETFLKFNDIDKIYVEDVDEVKTIFAFAWIGVGALLVLIIILASIVGPIQFT